MGHRLTNRSYWRKGGTVGIISDICHDYMKLYHSGNDPFDAHPSRSKKSQFFALLLVESWYNVMIFAYSLVRLHYCFFEFCLPQKFCYHAQNCCPNGCFILLGNVALDLRSADWLQKPCSQNSVEAMRCNHNFQSFPIGSYTRHKWWTRQFDELLHYANRERTRFS
jgi:hypothetical protein